MSVQVLKWRPRGNILFAAINTAVTPHKPGVFGAADCADQISLALQSSEINHKSKCAAIDVTDYSQIKDLSGDVTIDLTNYTSANLLNALAGTKIIADVSSVAVTNEIFPSAIAVGDIVALGGANPNYNITSFALTDSAGSPITLVANTDYTLDAANGMVTFLTVPGTQPYKGAYHYQNPAILAALTAGQVERWTRFNGFNTANSNSLLCVDFFRLKLDPISSFDLLPDEIGTMQLKGTLLADLSRSSTDPRGQYFAVAAA